MDQDALFPPDSIDQPPEAPPSFSIPLEAPTLHAASGDPGAAERLRDISGSVRGPSVSPRPASTLRHSALSKERTQMTPVELMEHLQNLNLPRPMEDLLFISPTSLDHPTLLACMHTRYRQKKQSYAYAAHFYRQLDVLLFYLPLMVLQASVAIIFLLTSGQDSTQKTFGGCVAAISCVIIAMHMKLKWGEMAERYSQAARTFALLAQDAFSVWVQCGAGQMNDEMFKEFTDSSRKLEKEVRDSCPNPPTWIVEKHEQFKFNIVIDPTAPMEPDEQPPAPMTRQAPPKRPSQPFLGKARQLLSQLRTRSRSEEDGDRVEDAEGDASLLHKSDEPRMRRFDEWKPPA